MRDLNVDLRLPGLCLAGAAANTRRPCPSAAVVDGLGGGHLHRLLVDQQAALAVAEAHREHDADERHRERHLQRLDRDSVALAATQQEQRADRDDEHRAVVEAAKIMCGKASSTVGLRQDREDVVELRLVSERG